MNAYVKPAPTAPSPEHREGQKQMPLIKGNQLLRRFYKRLAEAKKVDIAVAWVKCCNALETLVGEGTPIRIAVGVDRNVTDPCVLDRLNESQSVDLRIARSPHGIFHPKYFCFHGPIRTICWVGSANLTTSGFGCNDELVHEFDDSAGEGRRWFKSLWSKLHPDPGPDIDEYKKRYQQPKPAHSTGTPEKLVPLSNQSTWDDFVEGLRLRNVRCRSWKLTDDRGNPWDILGNYHSYLHTISTGQKVARLQDWGNLTKPQCNILLGRDDDEGAWALLGSIWPSGNVAKVFNPKRLAAVVGPARKQILHHVKLVRKATNNEIAHVAHEAVREIRWDDDLLNGFGPAAATRLLTLARPDCLVSVNRRSAYGLAQLAGLERSTTSESLANNYERLLNWVHKQPWFNAPRPEGPSRDRDIWDCRAALLDAFMYEEINGKLQPTR